MKKQIDIVKSQFKKIESHLEANDDWEDIIEWGMGREMLVRISKDSNFVKHEIWYGVFVQLRHEFTCKCPTLERAVEFADIYVNNIMELLEQYGWPAVENES